MGGLIQDFRFTTRFLRRNPGFTAVAAVTLALGIGANAAVFSIVNATIMRPLRFPDADRLMVTLSTTLGTKETFESAQGVFVDWRERSTSFETVAGARITGMILSGVERPHNVSIVASSFDFLPLLGVQPVLGRTFTKDEDKLGREAVALLDGGFLQREFGGNTNVLGRTIVLDDRPYTIIGVLPPDFHFAYFGAVDICIPIAADWRFRGGGDVVVVGRLRRGVTREGAQAELEAITQQIGREHVEDSGHGVLVEPLHEWIVGDVRRTFLTLLGAVGFVLLICCANVGNLLMARATARQTEMAIRASLGAGRFRLVRQTLAESVLLALIGGTLGIPLAVVLVRAVATIHAFYIPRADEIVVDYRMLIIAAAISFGSGILFGLAPALKVSHKGLGRALHQGYASAGGRAGGRHLRNALVVTQLALALVLLSGAGLMTNSLLRLLNIDLGFERANVVTIGASLPYKRYDRSREAEFHRRLMAEVSRMPGVQQASASDYLPLEAVLFPYELRAEGSGVNCEAMARHVAPNYLRVMGIRLLAGRDFEVGDGNLEPVRALINQRAARALFGADNPIGRHLITNYKERKVLEIVGVVGDAHQLGLREEPGPQLYLPLAYGHAHYVVARTATNTGDLTAAIRAVVRAIDPEVPAPEVSTMDAAFSSEVTKPRFYLLLFGSFAGVGAIVAAVGVYGLMSYTIARRTHEFGVRLALGAEPRDILRLILGTGMRLTCGGAMLGITGSLVLTRLLSAMLYGVQPRDPLTLACTAIVLAGVALLPCYIAARHATAVDPNVALRCE